MGRRDEVGQSEQMFVSLDTYLDRRTAYTFGVTAAGVRLDHYHASDNRNSQDTGFEPVWEARVGMDERGWVAELRIPFDQLRFTESSPQVWGMNIFRSVPSRNEEVYWSPIRRTDRVWASRFGELQGIAGIRPSRRLEIVPYLASSSLTGNRTPGDPFDNGVNLQGRVGMDMKMGLGSNLTLDATVNPDFGQVEADPAEVNLTAFETFFPERRPFFVEGSSLFGPGGGGEFWDAPDGSYFYSRRIGARPSGSTRADFVDHPATSTILGATKITGRLANGTSLGVLGAVTAGESARTFNTSASLFGRVPVAPRTTFGVGRVQQEFGPAGSTAGFMMTTVHRDLSPGDSLSALFTRNAFTASGDSLLRFRDGEYEIDMTLGVSHVAGEALAIDRLQRSSARYFQRPDVSYVTYDPTRTAMTGIKGGITAERAAGRHWLWQVSADFTSPEFEINDLGRLSRADERSTTAQLEYRETQPGRLFRNYSISLEHDRDWNYAGALQGADVSTEAEVTWPNFWQTEFGMELELPAQDQRLTRGGPSMATPRGWSTSVRISNSNRANTRANVRAQYGRNENGGLGFDIGTGVTFRPTPRWRLSIQPSYEREVDDSQFVTSVDGGRLETYGRRYVFAFVDRSTVSTEIRLDYAFGPDVNLEFYGEPFAASGRYYRFGELLAPGSFQRRAYGTDGTTVAVRPDGGLAVTDGASAFSLRNPDFNVLSFRSNVVLRWEWRPGSLLYAVWQQDRNQEEVRPDRVGVRDIFSSFGASGNHVFALKMSFWIG
jgi:hypothetical protein